jgi:hypothetical protein
MSQPQDERQLFLRRQQLSELTGVNDPEKCRFHRFGDLARQPGNQERRAEHSDDPLETHRPSRGCLRPGSACRAPEETCRPGVQC